MTLDNASFTPLEGTAQAMTFGIEEECFLVDLSSGRAPRRVPKSFVQACRKLAGPAVTFEMMQSQIELVSPVFAHSDQAWETMSAVRRQVSEVANSMGLGIIACGSHPLARWQQQTPTDKPRYQRIARTYQIIGARDFICGLHVHVAVPHGDRVQLMNRLMPWLPLFLALSTSSPFWNLQPTGLLAYRQSAAAEWPRAGIPDFFADEPDYDRFVGTLNRLGALRDGSEVWWAIRPSVRYPTLELRIADSCTRVEDSIALATLFRCLVRAHLRLPALGAVRSTATRRMIEENRWRAARYGVDAELLDEIRDRAVPVWTLLDEAFDLIEPDAKVLDPHDHLRTLREIRTRGTSAHEQLHVYQARLEQGVGKREALRAVISWLLTATSPRQADVAAAGVAIRAPLDTADAAA